MLTGTPIIAPKTGGLTRQVVDFTDGSQNGIALDIELQTLVGSQQVPYIYEDYVSCEKICDAMMQLYEKTPQESKELSRKVEKYARSAFSYQKTVDLWHESMIETIEKFKHRKNWDIQEI